MDPRISGEISIADLFDQFIEASTMRGVLALHHRILNYSDLEPCEFNVFYPKFKRTVADSRQRKNWRAKAIFSKIDKKANHKCYSNTKLVHPTMTSITSPNNDISLEQQFASNDALQHHSCLIIGGGPAGLRTAIELQLLGAKRVLVAEKRSRFSRNNVVHLWPFVIDDLKSLGAKKFYGKFCAGSIDHISIRQLQLALLKISLIIGCDFRDSCSYISNCPVSMKPINDNELVKKQMTDGGTNLAQLQLSDLSSSSNDATSTTIFDGDKKPTTQTPCGATEATCDFDLIEQEERRGSLRNHYSSDFVRVSDFIIPGSAISDSQLLDLQGNHHNHGFYDNKSLNKRVGDDMKATQDKENNCRSSRDHVSSSHSYHDNHLISRSSPNITRFTGDDAIDRFKLDLRGTRVHFECDAKHVERELHKQEWDVIIGADGHRNALREFFPRKEFRGKLAIAITANFINRQTPQEAAVPEISGISFIYNQDMFNALSFDTSIDLENICYYKDDTHYFVMTAKKKSLLERGVLLNDYATTQQLLSDSNVNKEALLKFARDAAFWTTGLEPLDFALNHYGQEDCAMFDFTSMYAAMNACKAVRTKPGGLTLFGLVGDSLLEPFWPTGSGCARGFLSSFDAAWMCRQWAVNKCAVLESSNHRNNYNDINYDTSSLSKPASCNNNNNSSSKGDRRSSNRSLNDLTTNNKMVLSVIAERESIYRILAQTTSENLQQNYSHWTLNPHTRYPNLNRHLVLPSQVEHLIVDENFTRAHRGDSSRFKKVKSPSNNTATNCHGEINSRKSPKKLKSSNCHLNEKTTTTNGNNGSYRSKSSLSTSLNKSKGKQEAGSSRSRGSAATNNTIDTWEFEESYRNLSDDKRGPIQYLNHNHNFKFSRPHEYSIYATINNRTGIGGSNNRLSQQLSSNIYDDEMARRARDIDDCIRLRRQRNQIGVVRDQILEQFGINNSNNNNRNAQRNRDGLDDESTTPPKDLKNVLSSSESASLLNELKRLREQRLAARINGGRDATSSSRDDELMSPLFLLNSIRRCASFAERVKSFEGKLDVGAASKHQQHQQNSGGHFVNGRSMSPKTAPIDNVKNLPQFATLQRLLARDRQYRSSDSVDYESQGGGAQKGAFFLDKPKKSKIPIMKLTKDDWNVKCWEERLAAYEKRSGLGVGPTFDKENSPAIGVDRASFVKSKSIDCSSGRSNDLPHRLRNNKAPRQVEVFKDRIKEMANKLELPDSTQTAVGKYQRHLGGVDNVDSQQEQSKSWVNHLRQELIKSSQQSSNRQNTLRNLNQTLSRPVKKLFADDEYGDLRKNSSSQLDGDLDADKHYDHLCINRPKNKYLSRNNQYKSHLSRFRYDKDTSIVLNRPITGHEKRLFMEANDEHRAPSVAISINDGATSEDVSSTIATMNENNNEAKSSARTTTQSSPSTCPRCNLGFAHTDGITILDYKMHRNCLICSNCSITLRSTEIQHYLTQIKHAGFKDQFNEDKEEQQQQTASNEFLCAICKPSIRGDLCRVVVDRLAKAKFSNGTASSQGALMVEESSCHSATRSRADFLSQQINYNELYKNIVDDASRQIQSARKEPSPLENNKVTSSSASSRRQAFRIAKSESVDGSEVVTLVLPPEDSNAISSTTTSKANNSKVMVDEEEIERILHLDRICNANRGGDEDEDSSSTSSSDNNRQATCGVDRKSSSSDEHNLSIDHHTNDDDIDDSSSLNSVLESLSSDSPCDVDNDDDDTNHDVDSDAAKSTHSANSSHDFENCNPRDERVDEAKLASEDFLVAAENK